MFPTVHLLLFVLLPLALAVRLAVKPRPDVLPMAQGVMRFCLGFAKYALLVSPLWHLSAMVVSGGPDSLSRSVAWMGFLSLLLSLHFSVTAIEDGLHGLGGLFGFKISDKVRDALTLRRVTQGRLLRWLAALVVVTLLCLLVQASPAGAWAQMKTMFVPTPRTVITVFQECRVWTDFHVITMFAALACFIGLPYSRDFLRVAAPWKAVVCLITFLLAVAMLWTHAAPMS